MALVRVDWNPAPRKIRQFGGLLLLFSLLAGGTAYRKGNVHAAICIAMGGGLLGVAAAAVHSLGIRIYRAWMAVAFVIGTVVSTLLLGVLYYGVMTPLGLFFKWKGRDNLRLRKGSEASYWVPLRIPDDKTYFERLS